MKQSHRRIGFTACMMLASACVYAAPTFPPGYFPMYYGGDPIHNVVIDDFSVPGNQHLGTFGASPATNQADATGAAIGDWRDLAIVPTAGTTGSTSVDTFPGPPGTLAIANPGTGAVSTYVTWDGTNAVTPPTTNQIGSGGPGVNTHGLDDGIGPAGYDLTSNGANNGILIDLYFGDLAALNTTVDLIIFDYGGGTHTATYDYAYANIPETHFFTFEDFGYATGYDVQPGEGPTSVGAIQMVINGSVGSDTYFATVLATQIPVPAPLALIGIGLVGLGAGRRRRAS